MKCLLERLDPTVMDKFTNGYKSEFPLIFNEIMSELHAGYFPSALTISTADTLLRVAGKDYYGKDLLSVLHELFKD